jgi:hypothetical protein
MSAVNLLDIFCNTINISSLPLQNPLCANRKLLKNEFYMSVIKVQNKIDKKLHIVYLAGAMTIWGFTDPHID